jgi:hypothetical protein
MWFTRTGAISSRGPLTGRLFAQRISTQRRRGAQRRREQRSGSRSRTSAELLSIHDPKRKTLGSAFSRLSRRDLYLSSPLRLCCPLRLCVKTRCGKISNRSVQIPRRAALARNDTSPLCALAVASAHSSSICCEHRPLPRIDNDRQRDARPDRRRADPHLEGQVAGTIGHIEEVCRLAGAHLDLRESRAL